MNPQRVGLWMIGALGGVGTTVALGLAALSRGLIDTTGLVTALPLFDDLDFDEPAQFVVGGHEVRRTNFGQTVRELHQRANVFPGDVLEACLPDLNAWTENLRPGTVLHAGPTIAQMADLPSVHRPDSPRAVIERLQADMQQFRATHRLNQVVVLNVASTEPPFDPAATPASSEQLSLLLGKRSGKKTVLPASALYAWAALELGLPYLNFTPSRGSDLPALEDLAIQKKSVHGGKDGKTGETLLKTVLAPMFALRNFRVLSWVGHNILGNRDGLVLNDPENKASKVHSKDQVLTQILGYRPQTLVSIEHIESLDDWKTAWDHVHFGGFLGAKMAFQFTWQGCDSLLAAPLAIDMTRLALLAQRRGEVGVLRHLACFFKSPMGTAEHDFFKQFALLAEYVQRAR